MKLITDEQTFNGATMHGTIHVKTYDDGYGPLWILRDSMGVCGIVRAQTWEDAYSICEDEIFPDPDPEEEATWTDETFDDPCWQESYGYRPNYNGTSCHYQKDPNGDYLERLTPELVEALSITLDIRDPEPEPEPPTRFHSTHIHRRRSRSGRHYVASWSGRYGTGGSRAFAGLRTKWKCVHAHSIW
jgi:hypothetical protein